MATLEPRGHASLGLDLGFTFCDIDKAFPVIFGATIVAFFHTLYTHFHRADLMIAIYKLILTAAIGCCPLIYDTIIQPESKLSNYYYVAAATASALIIVLNLSSIIQTIPTLTRTPTPQILCLTVFAYLCVKAYILDANKLPDFIPLLFASTGCAALAQAGARLTTNNHTLVPEIFTTGYFPPLVCACVFAVLSHNFVQQVPRWHEWIPHFLTTVGLGFAARGGANLQAGNPIIDSFFTAAYAPASVCVVLSIVFGKKLYEAVAENTEAELIHWIPLGLAILGSALAAHVGSNIYANKDIISQRMASLLLPPFLICVAGYLIWQTYAHFSNQNIPLTDWGPLSAMILCLSLFSQVGVAFNTGVAQKYLLGE